MSRTRRNQYRIEWMRYVNRCRELGAFTAFKGEARASAPFYRNGATFPTGWRVFPKGRKYPEVRPAERAPNAAERAALLDALDCEVTQLDVWVAEDVVRSCERRGWVDEQCWVTSAGRAAVGRDDF